VRRPPVDIARLGFAIAHALDASAPAVTGLVAEDLQRVVMIAAALKAADHPLIVSGTGSGELAVVEAAAQVAAALSSALGRPANLAYAVPECNSLGLALMQAKPLGAALDAAESGEVPAAIVLENDLYRRARLEAVESFLSRVPELAVIDHTRHATVNRAHWVLPGTTFAETDGTLVSAEGRAQRFFSVMPPRGEALDSWRWLAAARAGNGWTDMDDVTRACAATFLELAAIVRAAPAADFRLDGQKVPRQTHRRSGRTAATAHIDIHEPQPPADTDSALAFSMEGNAFDAPAALRSYSWAPGWNSNAQSIGKFQDELGGHLRGGDPGVRLFEPVAVAALSWFAGIPAAGQPEAGYWGVVRLHHVFGTEELSAQAAPVVERIPAPYVALHPADIGRLGDADSVELDWSGFTEVLPVRPDEALVPGTIGIPAGLPGIPPGPCPRRVAVRKAEPHRSGAAE